MEKLFLKNRGASPVGGDTNRGEGMIFGTLVEKKSIVLQPYYLIFKSCECKKIRQ